MSETLHESPAPNDPTSFEAVMVARDGESTERDVVGQFMAMSIESLQRWRPDLTDEILIENHIIPGRDFIMIHNGTIMRHFDA